MIQLEKGDDEAAEIIAEVRAALHEYIPSMEQKKQMIGQEKEQGEMSSKHREQERGMNSKLDKDLNSGLRYLANKMDDEKRLVSR